MSEKTLDQLITSLKKEAIDAAESEAEKILEEARMEAQQIVQTAQDKRDGLISEAEREAQAILSKGESALRQAGRDYTISVRNELLHLFQLVLEKETHKEYSPDLLKTAIVKVIENMDSNTELKFSEAFSEELADYIHHRLKTSEKLVSIVEDHTLLNGFSISNKEQGWSYTISPEEVAEALKGHLHKNWKNIFKTEA